MPNLPADMSGNDGECNFHEESDEAINSIWRVPDFLWTNPYVPPSCHMGLIGYSRYSHIPSFQHCKPRGCLLWYPQSHGWPRSPLWGVLQALRRLCWIRCAISGSCSIQLLLGCSISKKEWAIALQTCEYCNTASLHSDSARFGHLELVQLSPRGCPSVQPLPNRVTSLQLDHPLFGSLFIPVFGIYYSDICYLDFAFEWIKTVRYVYVYSYILSMFGQFNPTCPTWNSHALLVDVVFSVIISN